MDFVLDTLNSDSCIGDDTGEETNGELNICVLDFDGEDNVFKSDLLFEIFEAVFLSFL
jgi:hypothetical protein